jgi:hypothetical protein
MHAAPEPFDPSAPSQKYFVIDEEMYDVPAGFLRRFMDAPDGPSRYLVAYDFPDVQRLLARAQVLSDAKVRIASHRIASHRIASHRIASYRIVSILSL